MKTKMISAFAALALACGGTVATAEISQAATTCTHYKQKYARTGLPDLYTVKANCSSINNYEEVRGRLYVNLDYDVYTTWFRTKNRTYESNSKRAWVSGTGYSIRGV